jgi:hypothetical protein
MQPRLAPAILMTLVFASIASPQAQSYADGQRVDATYSGGIWLPCTVVKHNIKQGDYEVRCDGRPDTARVPDDADHIRPATQSILAAAKVAPAKQPAAAAPRTDINANLRSITLGRGGTPLTGLYLQLTPMMGNAASGRTSFDYFYFWPDGRLCEVLPPTGTEPADYDAMLRDKPRLCGRYLFTPAKLTIDVPDHPKAFDYAVSRFDGTNFVMDAYPTVKVKSYPAGAKLSGTFRGSQISQGVRQVWTFRPDGTFTLEQVSSGYGGGPARHLDGHYNLHGNTLDLGAERHTIYPLDTAHPGRLVIDGHDMDPN